MTLEVRLGMATLFGSDHLPHPCPIQSAVIPVSLPNNSPAEALQMRNPTHRPCDQITIRNTGPPPHMARPWLCRGQHRVHEWAPDHRTPGSGSVCACCFTITIPGGRSSPQKPSSNGSNPGRICIILIDIIISWPTACVFSLMSYYSVAFVFLCAAGQLLGGGPEDAEPAHRAGPLHARQLPRL